MDGAQRDLQTRTKAFALRVVRLYTALPKSTIAQVLGKQTLRSGTSVGAHYAEAQGSRSGAEFSSKLQGALQEVCETQYWLDLIAEAGIVPRDKLRGLQSEASELAAIFTAAVRRIKSRKD